MLYQFLMVLNISKSSTADTGYHLLRELFLRYYSSSYHKIVINQQGFPCSNCLLVVCYMCLTMGQDQQHFYNFPHIYKLWRNANKITKNESSGNSFLQKLKNVLLSCIMFETNLLHSNFAESTFAAAKIL